ncbi:hypothetical protein SKAU_G00130990 [Synaphobranchus kaupii]|uniref:Uncharacterized protein n=1 Tax=Synaphobranchus kaupii TaxID=118154 RepID=A0A9Q1FRE8_SYNKA|nr:hypothetical protein SKAU_G00130990 [Synaphobranchus kaupii]
MDKRPRPIRPTILLDCLEVLPNFHSIHHLPFPTINLLTISTFTYSSTASSLRTSTIRVYLVVPTTNLNSSPGSILSTHITTLCQGYHSPSTSSILQ